MNKDGMKSFEALDSREKTIAILGDRWWPNRKGIRYVNGFYVRYGRNVVSTELLKVSLLEVGTVLRLERDAWSMVMMSRSLPSDWWIKNGFIARR